MKVRACPEGSASLQELQPGVMVAGEVIGRWLQRQRERWNKLCEAQHERLVGVGPIPRAEAAEGRR